MIRGHHDMLWPLVGMSESPGIVAMVGGMQSRMWHGYVCIYEVHSAHECASGTLQGAVCFIEQSVHVYVGVFACAISDGHHMPRFCYEVGGACTRISLFLSLYILCTCVG